MSIIFVFAMIGWIAFGVMWLISLFKKNGTAKKNFSISIVCFVLFMIAGNFVDTEDDSANNDKPSEKVATTSASSKDNEDEEADAKAKAEAEAKAKVEAEAKAKAEAEAKAKAEAEAKAKEPISTDFSSFDDPYDEMTDIQKDAFWKDVKGKYVQWTGSVTEVTEKTIQLKIESTTLVSDVIVTLAKEEREKLININLDETITIKGKLSSKEGIFMPWGLDDTIIID